jgi:hypothetical protein
MPGRDYRKEYDSYHGKKRQKVRRAGRNAARRLMGKLRGKKAIAGKDVHHKDSNTKNNSTGNLSIMSRARNRGMQKRY